MEISGQNTDLPAIKRLPFVDTVEQLHQYNLHVARVCLTTSRTQFQTYKENKEKYNRQAQEREQQLAKTLVQAQQLRKKSQEAKQRQSRQRNQEKITKMEHFIAERRDKFTKKQHRLMEESSLRRQNYLQTLTSSFHHSHDRRDKIKLHQESEMQQSLLILQKNQEKLRVANERKLGILEDAKNFMRQKNESTALQNSKRFETNRKGKQLQKLVLKYNATDSHLSIMDELKQKRSLEKRKQLEKTIEMHRKKRCQLHELCMRKLQQEYNNQHAKIQKAVTSKYRNLQQSVSCLQLKRKQREKKLRQNTFYLQQEVEKNVQAILHKQHSNQVSLLNIKAEKERLHKQYLQDSFRATMRS